MCTFSSFTFQHTVMSDCKEFFLMNSINLNSVEKMNQQTVRLIKDNKKLKDEKWKLLKLFNLFDEMKDIMVNIIGQCECSNKEIYAERLNKLITIYDNEKRDEKELLNLVKKSNSTGKRGRPRKIQQQQQEYYFPSDVEVKTEDDDDPEFHPTSNKKSNRSSKVKKNGSKIEKLKNAEEKDEKERLECVWPGCGQTFLKSKRNHYSEKYFIYSIAEYQFDYHMFKYHNGEKTFKCSECDKVYANKKSKKQLN